MRRDDDILEPILPKSPPTAEDLPSPVLGAETDQLTFDSSPQNGGGGRSWERWVLVGCAVAATLCLVVITIRLTSIAEDQRVQACQARVFASEQLSDTSGFNGRGAQQRFAQELARCVGVKASTTGSD